MALTEQQAKLRKGFVGGSDISSICGLNPFASPIDVWAEKVFDLKPRKNKSFEAGNLLEPLLMDVAEEALGPILRSIMFMSKESLVCAANLDALLLGSGEPIEGKTDSIVCPPRFGKGLVWGEDGSEDVPIHVYLQNQWQMLAVGPTSKGGYVQALVGGRGFLRYRLHRSDNVIGKCVEIAERFWRDHVVTRKPPVGLPKLKIMKSVIREVSKEIEVSPEKFIDWAMARQVRLDSKKAEDEMLASLLLAMDDAGIATVDGEEIFHEKRNQVKRAGKDLLEIHMEATNDRDE